MDRWLTALRGPGALRLLLALTVFVHHLSRLAIGTAAVDVFFVLSGFWIWRMWQSKYATTRAPVRTFFISRAWRLLPVFLAVNAITIAGFALLVPGHPPFWPDDSAPSLLHFAASNLLLLGYGMQAFHAIGPAWSLDLEAQFYLLAPVLIALMLRRPGPVVAAAAALSAGAAVLGSGPWLGAYAVFFVGGMAAAQADWRPGRLLSHGGLVLALAVVALLQALPPLRPVLLGGSAESALHDAWNPVLNVALAVLVIPYAIRSTHQHGGRHDGLFADLAYIVYLLHWIGVVVLGVVAGHMAPLQRLPYVLLCVAGVLAVAYAIWRWIDRPLNRRRAQFVRERQRVPEEAAPRPVAPAPRRSMGAPQPQPQLQMQQWHHGR